VANNKECSHKCQTALKCVGYTWIGKDSETVIGALKAILSISMDDDDGGGGTCYLFDEEQAGNLHKVQYHHRGQSGIKKQHASAFSDRLQVSGCSSTHASASRTVTTVNHEMLVCFLTGIAWTYRSDGQRPIFLRCHQSFVWRR